ncbi:MAG: hypothetical protein RL514_4316 [Verrucomicrobiota bacterium]|jgi:hypothetical protein
MKTFPPWFLLGLLAVMVSSNGCKEPSPAPIASKASPDTKPLNPDQERAKANIKAQEAAMEAAMAKATAAAEAAAAQRRKAAGVVIGPGDLPGKDDYKELILAVERGEALLAQIKKVSGIKSAKAAADFVDASTTSEVALQKAFGSLLKKYPKLMDNPNPTAQTKAIFERLDRIRSESAKYEDATEALFERFKADPQFKAAVERATKARLENN